MSIDSNSNRKKMPKTLRYVLLGALPLFMSSASMPSYPANALSPDTSIIKGTTKPYLSEEALQSSVTGQQQVQQSWMQKHDKSFDVEAETLKQQVAQREKELSVQASIERAQQDMLERRKVDEELAQKRENERIAEEKAEEARKTEEAQKRAETFTQGHEPAATTSESVSRVVFPLAAGSYRLGAQWGARGNWASYHTGQDLVAPLGTPIQAVSDGVIESSISSGWAGNNVVLRIANGDAFLYAHLNNVEVKPGDKVVAGQRLGVVGNTGRSFGPHLHFEWYPKGTTPGDVYHSQDPMKFLKEHGA
jgi:murein DD-endopeptidase MepM/ murein hydrolase activator NlpD